MAGGRGVTGSKTERSLASAVSLAVIGAMIDDAEAHGYGPRHRDSPTVLGIYGDPSDVDATSFERKGRRVQVTPCISALGVREALMLHDRQSWLAVITDRTEQDLGVGILTHLVGHKLRSPNPWESVRRQFAASGIESSLHADPTNRALAQGFLLARPEQGWPPAPAGALTRDHALAAVAHSWLDVPQRSLDSLGVLRWTSQRGLTTRIAELRARAGDDLTDAALAWICARAGTAGEPLNALLQRAEINEALPVGLVLSLVVNAQGATYAQVLNRMAHRWNGAAPELSSLQALGDAATQVIRDLLRDRATVQEAKWLLSRSDALLDEVGAKDLAEISDLLPSGLTARLQNLSTIVQTSMMGLVDRHAADAACLPRLVAAHTQAIEAAWTAISRHALNDPNHPGPADSRIAPMRAAVRITRWLAQEDTVVDGGLAELALRQGTIDAWVDAAVNDSHEGIADPSLAEGITEVLAVAAAVRDAHDERFAAALAQATKDDDGNSEGFLKTSEGSDRVWLLEHLIRGAVVPLARSAPTLLLVLDGMSTGVATEILTDVLDRDEGWEEALLPESEVRAHALAVLPSLTEVSRASLLSGRLVTGQQWQEQKGYASLTSALGIESPPIFHKKSLDTSRPGFAVADDVAEAIADTSHELVTCVLNTIDDALDRSDPAGTAWTADAVKHLRPILDRALAAGRRVVLTADHGHVVERRRGTQSTAPESSSGRSRSAKLPPGEGEMLISGPRVLKHDGSAVLPFNERLRYGPLKAGYHGGAAPAEVVVPVIVLVPGTEVPHDSGLQLAPAQSPLWWDLAPSQASMARIDAVSDQSKKGKKPPPQAESLFETELFATPEEAPPTQQVRLGEAVLRSEVWKAQCAVAGNVRLQDTQVAAAVEALSAAPGGRLALTTLASVMSLPARRAQGAITQLQNLLNVESYPVVRFDGPSVVLDERLLREQFGIGK